MQFSKNKKHQYFFFFILTIYTIFNGGNSNILIQINFILTSILFLICLKDKNYNLHFLNFYENNKKSILIFFIFISYLIFQIIPLPIEILKFFALEKYKIINKLEIESLYFSISLSPSNSIFQILNFISLLMIAFIIKMIFYTERHKNRFYLYLSIIGFLSALFAIVIYLIGNPDFLIFKNSYYKEASTGFFINRTAFAIFLLFSFISSLELLKNFNYINKNKDNFFLKIYIRLFIIFITIGIITSFSRIGNFLLLLTIIYYSINEFFYVKKNDPSFRNTLILIILFDIILLGIYFGSSEILDRFNLLKEDFSQIYSLDLNLSRFQIIKFSLSELSNFLLFGYGSGAFETLFQNNFINSGSAYANHAHSDLIQFLGEFGLVGFSLLIISLSKFIFIKKNYNFINLILGTFLITILLFDFSLHIPVIQFLFITFFVLNLKSTTRLN